MPNVPRHLEDIAPGTSLLPIPFCLSLFVCLFFAVTIALDAKVFQGTLTLPVWLSVGNIDDARALLSALLGAVSTVLALIFSVSLLVFSAAATQFGPRLIHRFLRDRMMQITLGLFVATFFHALLTFVAVRQLGADQFVPQLTIMTTCTLVVISFASLVFFNNKIATSIQTNNVLPGILEDLQTVVTSLAGELRFDIGQPHMIRPTETPASSASPRQGQATGRHQGDRLRGPQEGRYSAPGAQGYRALGKPRQRTGGDRAPCFPRRHWRQD